MTIEEKAKRYDEALERAKRLYKDAVTLQLEQDIKDYETIFPELKESEDELTWLTNYIQEEAYSLSMDIRDEVDRVKLKNLQKSLDWLKKQGNKPKKVPIWKHWECGIAGGSEHEQIFLIKIGNIYSISSCLGCECDYIELSELDNLLLDKQSEHKPADKIEPKFKTGRWIVWQDKYYKVNYNGCGYELIDQNGLSTLLEYGTVEESAYLWDISKDAKDGDVLVDVYGNIGIFQNNYDFDWMSYCSLGINGGFQNFEVEHENEKTYPATKEQRDTLFAKMKEAGYEWDAEKKELRMIEKQSEQKPQRMVSAEAKEALYDKPKWSEEDERAIGIIKIALTHPSYNMDGKYDREFAYNWLKTLKQMMEGK